MAGPWFFRCCRHCVQSRPHKKDTHEKPCGDKECKRGYERVRLSGGRSS